MIDGLEACDDGSNLPNDGCDSTCQLEAGFNCQIGPPTTCVSICGDSKQVGLEACDDGDTDGTSKCKADCLGNVSGWYCSGGSLLTASTCITQCDDGIVAGTEICDDGDLTLDIKCKPDCTGPYTGWVCSG